MSLDKAFKDLAATQSAEQITKAQRQAAPSGWEPGLEMSGDSGTLTTAPLAATPDWSQLLAVWDLDPALYEVIEPVQYRAWDAPIGDGNVQRIYYYPANIRRRREHRADVDDFVRAIGRRKPKADPARDDKPAYLVAVADTQLGDGETQAVIDRFTDRTQQALDRYKAERKRGLVGDQIVLPWLGDCIQGVVSQGGALVWRNDLTLVEMMRVYRRLALWQIIEFAALAEVRAVAIPGNHDDPTRAGNIKSSPAHDSWAVEGLVMVEDALRLKGGYDHVTFVYPEHDRSTVTIDVQGTIVGMAHGHQFRGAAANIHKWWAGQSHGRSGIGAADILLTGHRHHFYAETAGDNRLAMVCPPLVSSGSYWTEATGDNTEPGMVTMRVGAGTWSGLEIL